MNERLNALPSELRRCIFEYIRSPEAQIIHDAFQDDTIHLHCRECNCRTCRRIRCKRRPKGFNHYMSCSFCSAYALHFEEWGHDCDCEGYLIDEEVARVREAWLSAWNDINVRNIGGLRKRPLVTYNDGVRGKKINYLRKMGRINRVYYRSFHVWYLPPYCRQPGVVSLIKA